MVAKAIAVMVLLTFCLWLYMIGQVNKQYGPGNTSAVAAHAQAPRSLHDDTAQLRGKLRAAERKITILQNHGDAFSIILAAVDEQYKPDAAKRRWVKR